MPGVSYALLQEYLQSDQCVFPPPPRPFPPYPLDLEERKFCWLPLPELETLIIQQTFVKCLLHSRPCRCPWEEGVRILGLDEKETSGRRLQRGVRQESVWKTCAEWMNPFTSIITGSPSPVGCVQEDIS